MPTGSPIGIVAWGQAIRDRQQVLGRVNQIVADPTTTQREKWAEANGQVESGKITSPLSPSRGLRQAADQLDDGGLMTLVSREVVQGSPSILRQQEDKFDHAVSEWLPEWSETADAEPACRLPFRQTWKSIRARERQQVNEEPEDLPYSLLKDMSASCTFADLRSPNKPKSGHGNGFDGLHTSEDDSSDSEAALMPSGSANPLTAEEQWLARMDATLDKDFGFDTIMHRCPPTKQPTEKLVGSSSSGRVSVTQKIKARARQKAKSKVFPAGGGPQLSWK